MQALLMMVVGVCMLLLCAWQVYSALTTGHTGLGSSYVQGQIVLDADVRENPILFIAILLLWVGATALGGLITFATATELPPPLWALVVSLVAGPLSFWLCWYRVGGPDPSWFVGDVVACLEGGERDEVRALARRIPSGALPRLAKAALDLEVGTPHATSYRETAFAEAVETAEAQLAPRARLERLRLDLGWGIGLATLAPFVVLPLAGMGWDEHDSAYLTALAALLPALFATRYWWRARVALGRAALRFAAAAVTGARSNT